MPPLCYHEDMKQLRFVLSLPFLFLAVLSGVVYMLIVGDLTLKQYWADLTLPFFKKPSDWGRP